MSDDTQALAEATPAQPVEVTATENSQITTPEEVNQSQESKQEERKFTQAELDEMIGKRLAREQRKWKREQEFKISEAQVTQQVAKEIPPVDQFDSVEAYAEALALKKADELIKQREIQKQQLEIEHTYAEKLEEAEEKYADFKQVAYNPYLPVTPEMSQAIKASEIGPDVAYWLGSNPKETHRISQLPPLLQAKEIGKIEAKLSAQPIQKKTTSAPEPIRPVTAKTVNPGVIDTTDPRSLAIMNTSEWIDADRKRQIAKMRANRSR